MPLYEIVLRFPDREEIRLTDRDGHRAGDEIVIAGRPFFVTGTEPRRPSIPLAASSWNRGMSQEATELIAHARVAVAEALAMHEASSEAAGGHSAAFQLEGGGSEASSGIASESPK